MVMHVKYNRKEGKKNMKSRPLGIQTVNLFRFLIWQNVKSITTTLGGVSQQLVASKNIVLRLAVLK